MADLAASRPDREATDVAFMFPGQGSQQTGMGQALAASSAEAQDLFRRADGILGWPLSRLVFEGPDDELTRTENLQPALFVTSLVALTVMRSVHPDAPRVALGHSLGEYAALVAAGALDFEPALRVVRRRGELMASAVASGQGGMAAVIGLDPERIAETCAAVAGDEVLGLANLNAPGQVVISGHQAAIDRAGPALKEAGAKGLIPLKVSAPFHCPLMQPAADGLAEALADVALRPTAYPVLSNVTAEPHGEPESIRARLVEQVVAPVRWTDCVAWAIGDGASRFIEVGPGKVLAGLLKRIDRKVPSLCVGDPEAIAQVPRFVGQEG